ncbi:hypothetical protein AB0L68_04120, partial [Streptomyces sp. NPDC052164]
MGEFLDKVLLGRLTQDWKPDSQGYIGHAEGKHEDSSPRTGRKPWRGHAEPADPLTPGHLLPARR